MSTLSYLTRSRTFGMTPVLTSIFAVACGAMAANIYYAQSLIAPIGADLGIHESFLGIIVMLTQLGYAAGLLLVVSLADLVENRRLILITCIGMILGLVGAATSVSATTFLLASLVVGFTSVGAQVLVPLAAHLTPEATRGRTLGNVMAGLLAGIMLARPLSSFIGAHFGWRAVFGFSAVLMAIIMTLLWVALPARRPRATLRYGATIASTFKLLATTPVLQRRAAYQGLLFAIFNLFWTAAPLMLRDRFGLDQQGFALFALAGAGGALAAPLAGRMADRGLLRVGTGMSLLVVVIALVAAGWASAAGFLITLAVVAVVLDGATQTNLVLSQRVIYGIAPDARGRINAAFMTTLFISGAIGSALAPYTYFHGGWWATVLVGAGLGSVGLLLFAQEWRSGRGSVRPSSAGP